MLRRIGIRTGSFTFTRTAAIVLLLSVLSFVYAGPVLAKSSSRAAIVVEATGEVIYRKAGGSRTNAVYPDLKLNQGDYLSIGPDAYVVLKIIDRDDEITIGENSEIYISDLFDEGNGKVTKVKSWAGSLWVKVKSLVSSEDEFEMETPTAVMGVRGTHFLELFDPVRSLWTTYVSGGVVGVTTVTTKENGETRRTYQESTYTTIYPAQQIELGVSADMRTRVNYADPRTIAETAPPKVLEAIVRSLPTIQQELDRQKETLAQQLNGGQSKPDANSILLIPGADELLRLAGNFDAFIPNVAKEAVASGKLDRSVIDEVNREIPDPVKQIQLDNVPALDKKAGLDPLVEGLKQLTPPVSSVRLQQERDELLANQRRLLGEHPDLEAERDRIDRQNRQTVEEWNKQAVERFLEQLDALARKQFEDNRKKNENGGAAPDKAGPGPSAPGSSPGASPDTSSNAGDSAPDAPVLVSPLTDTAFDPGKIKVEAKAPAGNTILLLSGGSVLAGTAAQGDTPVAFTLPDGTYTGLTLVSEQAGIRSRGQAVPKLSVKPAASPPSITLRQVGEVQQDGTVTFILEMNNFTETLLFSAVEAHVVYDAGDFDYSSPNTRLNDVPGTVFDGSRTAETLRQVESSGQKELIYAASLFGTEAGAMDNMRLNGSKPLVAFSLKKLGTSSSVPPVRLIYAKVVDNNGNTVYELPVTNGSAAGAAAR